MLEWCSECPMKSLKVALSADMSSYLLHYYIYSHPARSVLGMSLNTAADEPIAKKGQPDCLLRACTSELLSLYAHHLQTKQVVVLPQVQWTNGKHKKNWTGKNISVEHYKLGAWLREQGCTVLVLHSFVPRLLTWACLSFRMQTMPILARPNCVESRRVWRQPYTVNREIFEFKNFIRNIFVLKKFRSYDGLRKYFNAIFF